MINFIILVTSVHNGVEFTLRRFTGFTICCFRIFYLLNCVAFMNNVENEDSGREHAVQSPLDHKQSVLKHTVQTTNANFSRQRSNLVNDLLATFQELFHSREKKNKDFLYSVLLSSLLNRKSLLQFSKKILTK